LLVTTEVVDASVKWLETNREPWKMVESYNYYSFEWYSKQAG